MGKNDLSEKQISDLKARIAELPKGYISRKTINGKERLYLQWRDGDRIKSRYIKDNEKDLVIGQIAERKRLQTELDAIIYGASYVADTSFNYSASPTFFIKWGNEVIGEIDSDFNVKFTVDKIKDAARWLTPNSQEWGKDELIDFLRDRIVSPGRRDIDKILRKLGLTTYDALEIALRTHAISARDLLWITDKRDASFDDAITEVFESIFLRSEDLEGDSVDTPEGQNIKRYGVSNGKYGIYKKRISPLTTDVESELAVYNLGTRLGVPCCPCWRADDDTVFSEFVYDFSKEYIVHFRQLIQNDSAGDELETIISTRPRYLNFFAKMMALDMITRQDDRHLSNIAVKINGDREETYPLYDNGRSLFYEDTEETCRRACADPKNYMTTFGPDGTYLDHVKRLSDMGISFTKLMDLNVSEREIRKILMESGFSDYRLESSVNWITDSLEILRDLG